MTIDRGGGAPGDARRLLAAYEAGTSFLFASPSGTLLASGVDATVPKTASSVRRGVLPELVADFMRNAHTFGRSDPTVVGVLPFEESRPAHLVLPSEVLHDAPLAAADAPRPGPALRSGVRTHPGAREYRHCVERALRSINHGDLNTVTLARALELVADEPIRVPDLLANLTWQSFGERMFAVDLPRRGEDGSRDSFGPRPVLGRTLLGSGAHVSVSRFGPRVRCAVAPGGRVTGQREPEQEVVLDALRPWCRRLSAEDGRGGVEITGELRHPGPSALELAAAVHPAVTLCGTPVGAARRALARMEPFERGYSAGMVGWCDVDGDGEWTAVSQAVEVEDDSLRLSASARVTAESDPARVLAETSGKFRSRLAALGLDAERPDGAVSRLGSST